MKELMTSLQKLQRHLAVTQRELNQTKADMATSQQTDGNVDKSSKNRITFFEKLFKQKLRESESSNGIILHNEYEIIPFCRFTLNRVYVVDPGMGKRVIEKPIGLKKKEIHEVVSYAVDKLNLQQGLNSQRYGFDQFVEGIYRMENSVGSSYELYFIDLKYTGRNHMHKIKLFRPFGPIYVVSSEHIDSKLEKINLILPLSGRTDKFARFMERFVKVCVLGDGNVFLTVVYFGEEGLNDVKDTLSQVTNKYNFHNIKLVTLSESFSRGRGLQMGAQSWTEGSDVLLFLCDVDIVFNTDFLERCRLNTERGRRVYYPMVFSLYNPNVVYALHNLEVPSEEDQLVISKDTGFWRDFGFGMTCQYRSDFLALGGFDEQIQGWGMEDVLLYRKYVRSEIAVVRATDPGIFHLWHSKQCSSDLSWEQYQSCIRSKALNEASHPQLGMLAFKEEVDARKNQILKFASLRKGSWSSYGVVPL